MSRLIAAAKEGAIDTIRSLLAEGANAEDQDGRGWTALMWAAYKEHGEAVKMLVDGGADVNKVDNYGLTALIQAAAAGHTDTVQLLADLGADVNKAKNNGSTALMFAAQSGHKEIVQLLVDLGADVNKANKKGSTALIWATQYGHKETVKLLVEVGAGPPPNFDANNPLWGLAASSGNAKMLAAMSKWAKPRNAGLLVAAAKVNSAASLAVLLQNSCPGMAEALAVTSDPGCRALLQWGLPQLVKGTAVSPVSSMASHTYLNGTKYDGYAIHGIPHGHGVYTVLGDLVLEGASVWGVKEGVFKGTWPSGKEELREYSAGVLVSTSSRATITTSRRGRAPPGVNALPPGTPGVKAR